MNIFRLEKKANKFCDDKKNDCPNIWWCFGNSDEVRIVFFIDKWGVENAKPVWKMNNDGVISAV